MYKLPLFHLMLKILNGLVKIYMHILQVPRGFLEDQQGAVVPVLRAAGRQRPPEPHGLRGHVHHVQGQ